MLECHDCGGTAHLWTDCASLVVRGRCLNCGHAEVLDPCPGPPPELRAALDRQAALSARLTRLEAAAGAIRESVRWCEARWSRLTQWQTRWALLWLHLGAQRTLDGICEELTGDATGRIGARAEYHQAERAVQRARVVVAR